MYARFRRLNRVLKVLPRIYSGAFYRSSVAGISVLTDGGGGGAAWLCEFSSIYGRLGLAGHQWQRYSTRSGKKDKVVSKASACSFVRSLLNQPKGPSHCWLNATPGKDSMFKGDGIFLVIVVGHNRESFLANQITAKMFEKAKSLQQRYPFLQVIGLQLCPSVCLDDISSHLRLIIEYITFPILLSNKNILEEANAPCFFLSKGFQNPIMYPAKDLDLMVLHKAISDFNAENGKDADIVDVKSTWDKPIEVVKEPDACSASRNILFSFPGCISVDKCNDRMFLSDANHHRIIVLNNDGKILDAIGSSPGFEDGDFEMAKLMRPAASFYDSSEDCLYFVDSENHAIRRADTNARVVETVFPVSDGSQKKGLWEWILDKIWTNENNIKLKSEAYDPALLMFPWHLLKSSENEILVLNQSFGTLWIIDLKLGHIREVIEDSSKILEICGQMILEKCNPLKLLPADWLEKQVDTKCSLEGIPYGGLMSSAASCQDDVVFYDEVGQRVVRFDKGSASATNLRLSNFGNLGLPYWLTSSIEKMYSADGPPEIDLDHSECFRLLPGRVDIKLIVDIPQNTELLEQPQEGCIWRQARGAANEISGVEKEIASAKVSSTQKFYDDLDSLIFATPEEESATEAENQTLNKGLEEDRVRIGCTVNTSPGTSEVIIYAALYLRLKKSSSSEGESQGVKAARIADIVMAKRKTRRDLLVKLLMTTEREMEEIVFMRPLHVRLKFNCDLHPKGENSKDILLTDSSVEARVSL